MNWQWLFFFNPNFIEIKKLVVPAVKEKNELPNTLTFFRWHT